MFYFQLFLGFWLSSVLLPGDLLPGVLLPGVHEYLLQIRNLV